MPNFWGGFGPKIQCHMTHGIEIWYKQTSCYFKTAETFRLKIFLTFSTLLLHCGVAKGGWLPLHGIISGLQLFMISYYKNFDVKIHRIVAKFLKLK